MGSPVVWFEMHVADVERAKEFYGMLFGWTFAEVEGSSREDPYWLISTTEGTVSGGLTALGVGVAPGDSIVVYVRVESLKGALESAQLLGAAVEQPPTLISEDAGSYALIRDPDRALIGLWSPEVSTSDPRYGAL